MALMHIMGATRPDVVCHLGNTITANITFFMAAAENIIIFDPQPWQTNDPNWSNPIFDNLLGSSRHACCHIFTACPSSDPNACNVQVNLTSEHKSFAFRPLFLYSGVTAGNAYGLLPVLCWLTAFRGFLQALQLYWWYWAAMQNLSDSFGTVLEKLSQPWRSCCYTISLNRSQKRLMSMIGWNWRTLFQKVFLQVADPLSGCPSFTTRNFISCYAPQHPYTHANAWSSR